MRSKTILSTVAFFIAFAASAAFANLFVTKPQTVFEYVWVSNHRSTSCFTHRNNSTVASKISALIQEDKNNGLKRGKPYRVGVDARPPFSNSDFLNYAEAVEEYVNESSSMKSSDLPNDFQSAWREHMQMWRDYSEFLNKMKTVSNPRGWIGEKPAETDYFHTSEISRTWQIVLQTGANYGADVY